MSKSLNNNNKILICDEDETLCYLLKEQLMDEGFKVDVVFNSNNAIEKVKTDAYAVLFLDLNMKAVRAEEVLKFVSDNNSTIQVIIFSAQGEMRRAIECIKAGAYDFITKPYELDNLLLTLGRTIEHKKLIENTKIPADEITEKSSDSIVGNSPLLKRVLDLASKAARSDSSVLIVGEIGTRKKLMAAYIHQHSDREKKPFVVINCATLSEQLIEIELFGLIKGAVKDLKEGKKGLLEIADGGILFLDEIGDLSLALQQKILRILESGEYTKVGGIKSLKTNVRIIAATHKNLLEESDNKNFRKDLLFNLNVITLVIPPLRDRKEDILAISNHLLKLNSAGRFPKILSPEAKEILMNYTFTGNIRELENIIEQVIVFSEGEYIYPENLNIPQKASKENINQTLDETIETEEIGSLENLEKWYIHKTLKKNQWDRAKTAYQLGVSPKTLYTKIKKYELLA